MPTMGASLQRKMELTGEYLKLLEARANIKLNEMRANKMSDQVRTNFADYIGTLYKTHRYYHVIIAADFYRALFSGGDYPVDLTNQATTAIGTSSRNLTDTAGQTAGQAAGAMGLNKHAVGDTPGRL